MTYWMFRDTRGHWRWQLIAANGSDIIATSGEGYVNKAWCRHMIDVVAGSSGTPIHER